MTTPTRSIDPCTPPRFRPGFTVIELLVVIGIILILFGLFFAGAKIVTAQAKERDTKTALETCKTMFANYVQATHLSRIPPGMSTANPGDINWTSANFSWTTSQEPPYSATGQILTDTAYVMYAIEALPENQTIINNLPPSKVTTVSIQFNASGPNPTPTTVNVPILLDGYGNPIYFVPAGGLGIYSASPSSTNSLVALDNVNAGIITSAGIVTTTSTPSLPNYTPGNNPNGFPSAQPFFVSSGPDGNLANSNTLSDDNIYSFNN